MDIEYGRNATPAAMLNLVNGDIYSLDGQTAPPKSTLVPENMKGGPTAKMFAYLGGELRGANGRGGKGWIPDNQGFLQCGVLRVDNYRPRIPAYTPLPDGRRIVVTAQKGRVTHESWVIIMQEREFGAEVFFLPNRATAVREALENPDAPRRSLRLLPARTLRSYGPWGTDKEEMTCRAQLVQLYGAVGDKIGWLTIHRVLDLLFWKDLYNPNGFKRPTPWEAGLGLARGVDGQLYFNSCGILRTPVNPDKEFTKLFPWATFITDPRPGAVKADLYIMDRKGKLTLVGRYPLRGGTSSTHHMVELTSEEAAAMKESGTLLPEYVKTLKAPPVIV